MNGKMFVGCLIAFAFGFVWSWIAPPGKKQNAFALGIFLGTLLMIIFSNLP